jgi:hypothetical protein
VAAGHIVQVLSQKNDTTPDVEMTDAGTSAQGKVTQAKVTQIGDVENGDNEAAAVGDITIREAVFGKHSNSFHLPNVLGEAQTIRNTSAGHHKFAMAIPAQHYQMSTATPDFNRVSVTVSYLALLWNLVTKRYKLELSFYRAKYAAKTWGRRLLDLSKEPPEPFLDWAPVKSLVDTKPWTKPWNCAPPRKFPLFTIYIFLFADFSNTNFHFGIQNGIPADDIHHQHFGDSKSLHLALLRLVFRLHSVHLIPIKASYYTQIAQVQG